MSLRLTKETQMKYKALFLDLDGTILDTLKDISEAVNYSLKVHNLCLKSDDEIVSFLGKGSSYLISNSIGKNANDKVLFDDVFKVYKQYYLSHPSVYTKPYDGVCEVLLKFKQKGVLNINDQRPYILVGNTISALNRCREICSTDEIYTLSRDNITSNVIKKEMDKNIPTINLLEELFVADSNYKRRKIIINCIKASELAINNRFKEALKKIIEISPKDITKKDALKYLIFLVPKSHKLLTD